MSEVSYLIGVVIDGEFYNAQISYLNKGTNLYKDSMIVGHERRRFNFDNYKNEAIAIRVDERDNHALSVIKLGPEFTQGLIEMSKEYRDKI